MSTRHRAVTVSESLNDARARTRARAHTHAHLALNARVNGVTESRRNPLKDSGSELLGSFKSVPHKIDEH